MTCIWNGSFSRWNKIKDNFFSRREQWRTESVNRKRYVGHSLPRSGIYFNSAIVTRISGIPFHRHDPNEASKLLLVHRGCAGVKSLDAELLYKSASLLTTSSVRRMHYSLSAVFSRAVYFISISPDRARWCAF